MALTECVCTVDSQGRELVVHGTPQFPIACYHDDFSRANLPWHWHEELELAILTEGTAVMAAGNEKFTLNPGDGIFVNSGILHAAWDLKGSCCRFHSIVFHSRLVGGSQDSIYHQDYILPLIRNKAMECLFLSPDTPWQKSVLEAIEETWQACVQEPAGYEFQVRDVLSRLIFHLHSHMPKSGQLPGPKTLRDAQRIKTMLSCIHTRFGEELTAAQIAASAMVSDSECLRCFRATIGTTPIQYLKQYRIQRAAEQLTGTTDRISDIAARCGFQDMSYFTRSFREELGCTPSQYRKQAAHQLE